MIEPILTGHKGFTVCGPSTRTCNSDESDPGLARIGALWQSYMQAGGPTAVGGALDAPVTVAVYTDYESNHDGAYTLVVGAPIVHPSEPQADHTAVHIPDGSYLLFTSVGSMPEALIVTWQEVLDYFEGGTPYVRTYRSDFELHDASAADRVEIYVGVR